MTLGIRRTLIGTRVVRAALFVSALIVAGAAVPAQAGEHSTGAVIGFTADGNHFVFEEYGTTDGLGAPYVNLFAIDIANDKWIKGTPVRIIGTEAEAFALEKKLADAGKTSPGDFDIAAREAIAQKRRLALKQARPALSSLGPLYPGETLVHNPPREFTSDNLRVRFSNLTYRTRVNSDLDAFIWRLELQERQFPPAENCFGQRNFTVGFALVLFDETKGREWVLNNDQRVPNSRKCPQTYYIEQVQAYARPDGRISLAVLVRYSRPGFEGPDGRLLAVTTIVEP